MDFIGDLIAMIFIIAVVFGITMVFGWLITGSWTVLLCWKGFALVIGSIILAVMTSGG